MFSLNRKSVNLIFSLHRLGTRVCESSSNRNFRHHRRPPSAQQTGTEEWQHHQAVAEIIKRNQGRAADDRASLNTWLCEDHGCNRQYVNCPLDFVNPNVKRTAIHIGGGKIDGKRQKSVGAPNGGVVRGEPILVPDVKYGEANPARHKLKGIQH